MIWAAVVAALTVSSIVWLVAEKPLARDLLSPADDSVARLARKAVGHSYWYYRQMIGIFGFLDTSSPSLTIFIWTALIGALLALAVAFAPRRWIVVLGTVLAASFVLPIAIDVFSARSSGNVLYWQGRYGLPFAVGVPIVAALSVPAERPVWPVARSRLVVVVGVSLVVAQVLAFGQNLRRYTMSLDGPIQPWFDTKWSPPVPAWFLTIAFTLAIATTTWWFLRTPERQPVAAAHP